MVVEKRFGGQKDFVITERDRKRIEKEDTESSKEFKEALKNHNKKKMYKKPDRRRTHQAWDENYERDKPTHIRTHSSNKRHNSSNKSFLWIFIAVIIIGIGISDNPISNRLNLKNLIDTSSLSEIPFEFLEEPLNSSELPEDKQKCPTPTSGIVSLPLIRSETTFRSVGSNLKPGAAFDSNLIGSNLNYLLNTSIWRIEGNIRNCYKGKYKGQYPDWFYCDDMIVSRWETTSSGAIKYRWYTAVSATWEPEKESIKDINSRLPDVQQYVFNDFSCDNGQKVTVNKETISYYVHVSRDGTEIRIGY